MKRMACALALAAGTSLAGLNALPSLAAPSPFTVTSGLQVSIAPPKSVTDTSVIPLDLKFKGGVIKYVELYIDGARAAKRTINEKKPQGTLAFSIDPGVLSEGDHEILVKAFEFDGTCASATTHLNVLAGDMKALARFVYPVRNAEVQGVVPIKIKVDDSLGEPFVSFVLDNEFLKMSNYAPYVYNLDSTKFSNGSHMIEVEVFSVDNARSLQKLMIPITIKNVGGFTKIQPTLPSANKSGTPLIGMPKIAGTGFDFIADLSAFPIGSSDSTGVARTMAPEDLSPSRNLLTRIGVETPPITRNTTLPAVSLATPIGTPPAFRNVPSHVSPALTALLSSPRDQVSIVRPETLLARNESNFDRPGGIALRPGTERHLGSRTARTATTAPKAKPAPLRAPAGMKTFEVSFESAFIQFDVAPRVEHGLPLAPFRAIFEKSGGEVTWFNDTKKLRATDMDRLIEISIGDKQAKVNNLPVSLEAVPYLDHGRTIVPLSFFRDAMDLKVNFDPATGHVLVERK